MMEDSGSRSRVQQAETERLVHEVRLGNEAAFREFFLHMQPEVFRFLYRYTRNRQAAEDLTQESFLRFWEARDRLDPKRRPPRYVFRIAGSLF
ncbi:MAG: polymerase ECF-type sigma factor [Bacteroidetes bacterium]|jgi:RNA polymerase sigma-70 factor (ECF subfamily)|nr:polymerase ECF-type sigma factor [Bacteroidota bacterium]